MRKTRDLLLTGHEDGSVKFWDVSSVSMSLLYKVNTASYFEEGFSENGGFVFILLPFLTVSSNRYDVTIFVVNDKLKCSLDIRY